VGELAMDTENQRNWRRRKVLWFGTLNIGGHAWDVRVCDIAASGAKIKMDLPLKAGAPITLSHEKFGTLSGQVVWQEKGELGLSFDESPSRVLDALGSSADVLGLST
jgi:hypothetical protein